MVSAEIIEGRNIKRYAVRAIVVPLTTGGESCTIAKAGSRGTGLVKWLF